MWFGGVYTPSDFFYLIFYFGIVNEKYTIPYIPA